MINITYTAQNMNGESIEFTFHDPIYARRKAIRQIKKWKAINHTYIGLRLTLSCYMDKALMREHDILTGDRMHTPEIIMALHDELVILNAYAYELPVGIIKSGDMGFTHIADDLILLYYFTAF
jgi:hypothetical protein